MTLEPLKEPISVRIARINSEIVGKNNRLNKNVLLTREGLLDALQALYDECCIENLQKYDANIAEFVNRYKQVMKDVGKQRVNKSDFEIKNVIGRGHFGEVHVVKERQTGDIYAMKTIRKAGNDIKRTSFEEERNIMAYANSPWLTFLQYAFQDSTYLFFIMEYHPGGDLLGLLHRQGGTIPESAAKFYIAELTLALEDLHKMGYVHRDIKPDNLLLDRCGHLKLADFGSAAKLKENGLVTVGPPVGTPDYIAPEVLQCIDSNKSNGYGIGCDFWSMGVLAYEMTVGDTPFTGHNTTAVYSKIMNFKNNLNFPPDITLSTAYISFIKGLIVDEKSRLTQKEIKSHALFKNMNFDNLRDQVPPYVPKITSVDDTSNFIDIHYKKKSPCVDNFKKKTQFSGRNLPYIGFTFTPDQTGFDVSFDRRRLSKDEAVQNLRAELENLRKQVVHSEGFVKEKDGLEKKLEEKTRKLQSLESLRDQLERDLANNITESAALKRTLELERKERSELEKKAMDLIKAAKLKWEASEKSKIDNLTLELNQEKEKVTQLSTTNHILNEQLQLALKQQEKQKESLNKVENLSRRSVIGLESRLEKVTSETQNTITELQIKLTNETRQKKIIEKELIELKEKEKDLNVKLAEAEEKFRNLLKKLGTTEKMTGVLRDKVTELEQSVQNMETFKEKSKALQNLLDESQKVVRDLEMKNNRLQSETKSMEKMKQEIDDLNKMIQRMQNDKTLQELQMQLQEEKEKFVALKKQMENAENMQNESQELREMRTKLWRMDKELGNCKIDKRILERELKDAQNEITSLNKTVENLNKQINENKKKHEEALLELSNINESVTLELLKLKDNYKNLQTMYNNEKEKSSDEKEIINELKGIIQTKDNKIKSLDDEINEAIKQKSIAELRLNDVQNEKVELKKKIENLQKEKAELKNNLDEAKRKINNVNLNMEALREACTLLENQVIEYEKINESYKAKQVQLNENTEKLVTDLCKAKQDIQDAKKLANEEKSLKLLAEAKAKRLQEDVDCLQSECQSYKQQCIEYKQYSTSLTDELTVAEEKITDLEVNVKSYERQIENLLSENNLLKEEIAEYLTQIGNIKETNYSLNHKLKESKCTINMLMERIDEMERTINERNNFYKERELKADSTIQQQTKLIDYLQTKIDELSQKKKTFADKLFGHSKKENQPPIALAMNYRDLETQLQKERRNNKLLQEEIFKLKGEISGGSLEKHLKVERHKSEILSPKSQAACISKITFTNEDGDLSRQNSLQRMHHNIPHRFETKLCTVSMKCAQCSNQIMMGRNASICKECHISAHVNCASSLPKTCGLPLAYAKHFKESLSKLNQSPKSSNRDVEIVNIEGFIKVPGKTGWEKRYARLTDTAIDIFTNDPAEHGAEFIHSINLKSDNTHCKVLLEPLASEIGIPVANSDIPFILKVEIAPNTTCWPPKCFIFMTLSVEDRESWFNALQKIFCIDLEKEKVTSVVSLKDNSNANCLVDLTDEVKIIGTDKGLYSFYNNTLLHIEGPSEVHNVAHLPKTNAVLLIIDSKQILVVCDLNHLITLSQCAPCSKPTLKYRQINVNNLSGFHILQVSHHFNQNKVVVATSTQLIIIHYDLEKNDFFTERILDTAQPTSCVLFTENSLIVGADKFFEIDLNTFQADEFLDMSDIKLKQVLKCCKIGSFPLAIVKVNKNPKEYLLCFNEFSIFVDEYGSCSREFEIKFSHLPLAFHFVKPYLFIVQFSAVEILKITDEVCKENNTEIESIRIEFDKLRYIGSNKFGIYISEPNGLKYMEAKRFFDGDLCSVGEVSTDVTENDSDRFSFTSSMVQSLDGQLSDESEDISRPRRVKFSQTEL